MRVVTACCLRRLLQLTVQGSAPTSTRDGRASSAQWPARRPDAARLRVARCTGAARQALHRALLRAARLSAARALHVRLCCRGGAAPCTLHDVYSGEQLLAEMAAASASEDGGGAGASRPMHYYSLHGSSFTLPALANYTATLWGDVDIFPTGKSQAAIYIHHTI